MSPLCLASDPVSTSSVLIARPPFGLCSCTTLHTQGWFHCARLQWIHSKTAVDRRRRALDRKSCPGCERVTSELSLDRCMSRKGMFPRAVPLVQSTARDSVDSGNGAGSGQAWWVRWEGGYSHQFAPFLKGRVTYSQGNTRVAGCQGLPIPGEAPHPNRGCERREANYGVPVSPKIGG